MKVETAIVTAAELLQLATRLQQSDRYLSLNEACELTGFSKRTIQKAKDLKRYRPFDGALRFRLSEIHAWMRKHAEQNEPEKQDEFLAKIKRVMGGKL